MKKLPLKLASFLCALTLTAGTMPVSFAQTTNDADHIQIVQEEVLTDKDDADQARGSDQQSADAGKGMAAAGEGSGTEDEESGAAAAGKDEAADDKTEAGDEKTNVTADNKTTVSADEKDAALTEDKDQESAGDRAGKTGDDAGKTESSKSKKGKPVFKTMAAGKITFDVTAGPYPYTGSAVTPVVSNVKAVYDDETVKDQDLNSSDYKIYYVNSNTDAGTVTMFLRGEGDYKDLVSEEKAFTISPASILNANVSLSPSSMTYTGAALVPTETVIWNGYTLRQGKDYTVKYYNNINPGLATVAVYGTGNFNDSVNVNFSIAKANQSLIVSPNPATVKQNKKAQLTVTGNQGTLSFTSSDTDIVAVNSSGTFKGKKAGTAVITVTAAATATYNAATVRVTVKVTGVQLTTDNTKVTLSKTKYTYDGKKKKPTVTVKYKGKKLTKNTDYKVSYLDNVDAGKATVVVKGINKYSGQVKKKFKINMASNKLKAELRDSAIDLKEKTKVVVKKSIGEITFTSSNTKIATVTDTGIITGKREGTCTITVTAEGDINHKKATKKFTLTVGSRDLSDDTCKVTLSRNTYVYDGNEKRPTPTVKVNGKTLKRDTNYSVSYYDNEDAGIAKVVIRGRGDYTGSRTVTFKINKAEQENFTISLPGNRIPLGGTAIVRVSGARGQLKYGSKSPTYAKPLGNGKYQGLKRTQDGVTITVTACGDENYYPRTRSLWVQIN